MNKINSYNENNLRYKDIEFNYKKNDDNQKYNNRLHLNINKDKNNLYVNKSNNNISMSTNSLNKKIQKNKIDSQNINKNEKNIPKSLGNSKFPELTNKVMVDNGYNSYIDRLKNKLSITRAERRKKEEEATAIQHRITVLKNKEQSKIQQFKKMKGHINKILNNRLKIQDDLKLKLNEKNNYKNKAFINYVPKRKCFSSTKRNLKNTNYNHNSKNNKNIYTNKQNIENSLTEQKTEKNDINIDNFNIEDDIVNDNNIEKNSNDNIKILKQKLIEKIKQDEEEKKRIEIEIAKIEEEENKLLCKFNSNKMNN